MAAEVDWFIDNDENLLQEIRSCIDSKQTIPTDRLTSLTKLNACLFNFSLSHDDDYYETGYSILDMDEQYSAINIDSLTESINQCHDNAKMLKVNMQDVSTELGKKRETIRQAISIDAQYGDALFEKAKDLVYLGQVEKAMTILNGIIDLYDAIDAHQLKGIWKV